MWFGLLFSIPGARKRDAIEALIMRKGAAAGFGKGFISGSLMNWRAVINIIGPLVFGNMYTFGRERKFPGLVFFVGAFTCLAAEGVLQTLPDQLFLDAQKKHDAKKATA
jgi:hypothetical protein